MIDLSVTAGRIFSPRNAFLAGLRDVTPGCSTTSRR